MNKICLAPFLVSLLALGCGGGAEEAPAPSPSPKAAAPSAPSGDAGALSGAVTFDGDVPGAEDIQLGADPACARMHPEAVKTEFVIVGDTCTWRPTWAGSMSGAKCNPWETTPPCERRPDA